VDATLFSELPPSQLGERELRQLIDAGEIVAERKAGIPADGMGPTVAAFANSGGGWVLLGVRNDGTIAGFEVPGRAEPQDWLRDKLRTAVDPLPPFACRMVQIEGRSVLVIRVEPSMQTPHVVKATGTVLIRERGGRQPIASREALLELCVRPEQAEHQAIEQMTQGPLVLAAVSPRDLGEPVNGQTRVSDWTLVASPLWVPEDFRRRALSRETVRAMQAAVLNVVARLGPTQSALAGLHPQATGVFVSGQNTASGDEATLLLDAGGVVVAHLRKRLTDDVWHVGETADGVITPLLGLALAVLHGCVRQGRSSSICTCGSRRLRGVSSPPSRSTQCSLAVGCGHRLIGRRSSRVTSRCRWSPEPIRPWPIS
jgi:hypothetical protein